jgi:hypothetical protein
MIPAKDRAIARANTVQAVGLLTDDSTSWVVDMLFMQIINDPEVDKRANALGFVVDEETGLETAELKVGYEDYVAIVQGMTPAEKSELRQRVGR